MVAKSSPSSMKEQLQASANQIWSSMKQLEQSMKSTPDKGNNNAKEGVQGSFESVIRIMFESCAVGRAPDDEDSDVGTQSGKFSSRKMSQSTCEPASPQTKLEDEIFNIFADEHMKAEDAVCHLREQMEMQRRSPPRHVGPQKGNVPSMFPASSPKEKKKDAHPPVSTFSATSPTRTEKPGNYASFDDDISAISQDTLEELALLHQGDNAFLERVHSDVTQDPVDTFEESWKQTLNPNKDSPPHKSPIALHRTGRSHGTMNTKQTHGTKSTMSTQTNEFASVFRKDEQRYWQEVVQGQDASQDPGAESIGISSRHERLIRARELVRKRDLKARRDGTSTTVNSSVYSSRNSQDIAVNILHSDPDRFMDVIVVPPGTEMAEI